VNCAYSVFLYIGFFTKFELKFLIFLFSKTSEVSEVGLQETNFEYIQKILCLSRS
jgi:hypothetical protein